MKLIVVLGIIFVTSLSQGAENSQVLDHVQVTEVFPDSMGESLTAHPAEDVVLSESQVPLSISKSEVKNSEEVIGSKVIISLVGVVIVLLGGLYFVRKLAQPKNSKSGTQINVLTQHWLGPKKSLAIVRVAGESILIGITEQNISMIKSLSLLDEDIPESTPVSFSKTMQSLEENQNIDSIAHEEDFSFNHLKQSIGKKIKNLRSIH